MEKVDSSVAHQSCVYPENGDVIILLIVRIRVMRSTAPVCSHHIHVHFYSDNNRIVGILPL